MLKDLLRKIVGKMAPAKDHVVYRGSTIPAPGLRWCGAEFKDDAYYIESAEREARRLQSRLGANPKSRVLDMGCGQGRLANGILRVIGDLDYTGVDVNRDALDWCRRHLQGRHPRLQFQHLDVSNERYNQAGKTRAEGFRFSWPDRSFDVIYLYSVFSHMTEEDMRAYLVEFKRVLAPAGKLFFTAFVEEGVPPVAINPEGYIFKNFSGPLHVVRYEKNHLIETLRECGFALEDFSYATEADRQSAIYAAIRPEGT